MNRADATALVRSIKEHAEIAESFLADPQNGGRALDRELMGRLNLMEARLLQLRAELLGRPRDGSGRRDNVHILGDRTPTGTPAA